MEAESPYQRVQRQLGEMISQAKAGDQLPTEPQLSLQLGVSRSTLREAMRSFETQGLLIRRQGSGTFVANTRDVFDAGLEVLESLESIAKRLGMDISMGGLTVEHIASDNSLALSMNLPDESDLVWISRVISKRDQPIAFLEDILPGDILSAEELQNGFTGSVLDLLIHRGYPLLDHSSTEIKVIPAPDRVARALDIQRGEGLLMFEADLIAQDGRVIDHSYSYFLPGCFRFHVNRRIGNNKK